MPPAPTRPPVLHGRVFRGSAAVRDGHLTAGQLRSSAWVRLFPDVYCCGTLPVTHRLRALAASRILVPGAVVAGPSAATVWGLALAEPADDVHLLVRPAARHGSPRGLRISRAALTAAEVCERGRVRLTSPVRTALDLARTGPLDEAVVTLDRLVDARIVDLGAVRSAAAATTGRGCRQARTAVALADGLAGSPQETRLRLLLHRSALPDPVAQFTVRAGGVFVARVDFAWPERRLALEYDGAWHGEPGQFAADRARLNRLTAAGWRVVFVTAADLHDPARLIARIATELAR